MDIIESVTMDDYCSISHLHRREIIESSEIGGYVTVTINKGRPDERVTQRDVTNLLTEGGRDFFHAQIYTNTSAGTKAGNGMAISDDATNVTSTDTILVGEETAGGLTRVVASTISHTASTNVTTLENTYTATAVFSALHKAALFNQDTIGGTMTHASDFDADVDLEIGDTVTVTWTLTAG